MRWQATERLTLNAQVTRFGWSEFDAIRIGPPLDRELRQDYHDTTSLAGGIDYQAAPALTLRAGIQADESPTPDAGEPRVPDADRMMYTAGGSYRLSDRVTFDAPLHSVADIVDAVGPDVLPSAGGADGVSGNSTSRAPSAGARCPSRRWASR